MRGLSELEDEIIRLADGLVLRAVLVALRERRRQGPHSVHPVLRVLRIGVDLGLGDQFKAR